MLNNLPSTNSDASIAIRPLRNCFLLPMGDEAQMEVAIRACCSQWGGMLNILVPYRQDGAVDDVFVHHMRSVLPNRIWIPSEGDGGQEKSLSAAIDCIKEPLSGRIFDVIRMSDFDELDRVAHPVAMAMLDDKTRRELIVPRAQSSDLLSLLMFGGVHSGHEGYYSQFFSITECDVDAVSRQGMEAQISREALSSPLKLTLTKLAPRSSVHRSLLLPHFDIVVASSYRQLCYYWNLRATRAAYDVGVSIDDRVILVTREAVRDASWYGRLRQLVSESIVDPVWWSNLHVRFCVEKGDVAAVEGALSNLSGYHKVETVESKFKIGGRSLWDGSPEVLGYYVDSYSLSPSRRFDPGFASVQMSGYNRKFHRQLIVGANRFEFDAPNVYADVGWEGVVEFRCPQLLSRYPRAGWLAESIVDGAMFEGDSLVSVRLVWAGVNTLECLAEEDSAIWKRWKDCAMYDFCESPTSRYSDALVLQLGGIEGVKLLSDPFVNFLMSELCSQSTKKIAQRLKKEVKIGSAHEGDGDLVDLVAVSGFIAEHPEFLLRARSFHEIKSRLADAGLEKDTARLIGTLEEMNECRLIVRGYSLTCPECGTPQWRPIQNLNEHVQCVGCFNQFRLPIRASGDASNEIAWKFRLNALADRAMDLDALPALLAVYRYSRHRQVSCVAYGLEIKSEGQAVTDFDFSLVANSALVAGECKSGNRLTEKDLVPARIALDLGYGEFAFCTMGEFTAESQELISEFQNEVRSKDASLVVTVLNGKDLLAPA